MRFCDLLIDSFNTITSDVTIDHSNILDAGQTVHYDITSFVLKWISGQVESFKLHK